MALRRRLSLMGLAMPPRSGLLPWNEPAHAKLLQWTCPMRAVLTSDFTYSVEHAAIVHARAQTSVARNAVSEHDAYLGRTETERVPEPPVHRNA